MNASLRLPILLAIAGLGLVFALLFFRAETSVGPPPVIVESEVNGEQVCTVLTASSGGDFVEGIVGAPRFLNPLLNDGLPVDRQISSLIFDGLVRYDQNQRRFVGALAQNWEVSEDGTAVTFNLNPSVQWHDGESFTADDVIFTYELLQLPDFPASPALKGLWQTVSMTKVDEFTVLFELSEPYAPFLEATTRGILPEHILAGVTAVDIESLPFNRFPVGTGPYQIDLEQDWTQTGQLRLLPNVSSQQMLLEGIAYRFFPDFETLSQAFTAGEINGFSQIPAEALPEVLQGEPQLVTNSTNRVGMVLFNLRDSGHDALKSNAVRQALAVGIDRQRLIDASLDGQAVPIDGPYLSSSWAFAPQIVTPIQTNVLSATAGLAGEGWVLDEGAAIRQNEASQLTLDIISLVRNRGVVEQLALQMNDLGVGSTAMFVSTGTELRDLLRMGQFDLAIVDVLPTDDPDLYDFWSQEAIVRGQNYGGWNNRRASEALE
ncbi:MAG: ABC transporter substrate-binding protein, partial [Chloroflexota bacterium]